MADKKPDDLGMSELQAKADKENEQGFIGRKVDENPNSAYTAPVPKKAAPVKKETKDE